MVINDAMIEVAATSDAAFDGRELSALGAADRRRYRDRAKAALAAALPLILEEVAKKVDSRSQVAQEAFDAIRDPMDAITKSTALALATQIFTAGSIATAIRAMGEKANG